MPKLTTKKIPFQYLLCVLVLSASMPLFGQLDAYFDHFTTQEGLSNSRIRSFHHDRDGFIWIGTASGLNWFNAYEFRSFKAEANHQKGLLHNGVHAILEDQYRNFWVSRLPILSL